VSEKVVPAIFGIHAIFRDITDSIARACSLAFLHGHLGEN
jgi:hypothetical protein